MSFLKAIFGDENKKALKALEPLVAAVNSREPEFERLSLEELKEKTPELKERLSKGESLDALLPEAFALVREAAKRTLTQRHFDVQLMGGILLHQRGIAEMKTGEGKTLVATLPVYLNALEGKGVHVVTVNDYLSRRDAVWMGQIYAALDLSVAVINHDSSYVYDASHTSGNTGLHAPHPKRIQDSNAQNEMKDVIDARRDEIGSFKVLYEFLRPSTRREAYEADITYGTNSEFGFDYLRDNIEYDAKDLRQRELNFAIVDEIDSILIDEARTPLIISAPSADSENLYAVFAKIASALEPERDYKRDEKFKAITMTDDGIERAEKLLGIENMYTDHGVKYVHHLETAVRAKALFHRDKEYVVREGQVVIVDEFTGRLQPGRRWSEGLHQAIEAKEGVTVERESRTYASVTYQNFFRMYKRLAGMTGTALTSKEEFFKVYGLDVTAVPTNQPMVRFDHNDLIFQTEAGKFKAIARKVKEKNEKGQPVLIGTVSIEKNEMLGSYLSREGIRHEILNAKNHEREGEIIAQAGRKGAVTIATNMAGRGVDIKLGGNPATSKAYEDVKKLGGLFVLATERHEARRIDNQLRGRSGRQGDPGETAFYVSMEDSLMRIFASETMKKMMGRLGVPEDEPIENRIITRALENAQTKIEGFNFDARKHVLEYDDVLNLQRQSVYARRRRVLLGTKENVEEVLGEMILKDEMAEKVITGKRAVLGEEEFWSAVKRLILQTIDMFWVDHLEMMDYLRGSVRLRAYGQRDPLVEYKKEALRLFKNMEEAVVAQVVSILPNIGAGAFVREEMKLKETQKQMELISSETLGGDSSGGPERPGRAYEKVGRNDPCPCSAVNPQTGKIYKYKQCGLINAPHHKK